MRDLLDRLESVKNRVVSRFAAQKVFADDAKEAYYRLIAAYQLCDPDNARSARGMVEAAKSAALQCASAMSDERLRAEFLEAFEAARAALAAELDRIAPPPPPRPSADRVRRISESAFELPCSVCGATAVVWKRGTSRWMNGEGVIYEGITMGTQHPLSHLEVVFGLLSADEIDTLDEYAREHLQMSEGMDAYCPQCRRVFCRAHYNVQETYDEGFYDCTYGTCPAGHRRMIDD